MPASAHDIAAALLARAPDLDGHGLQDLLERAQAHHVDTFGEPLFIEDGHESTSPLGEAELNSVGYVLSHHRNPPGDPAALRLDSAEVKAMLAGVEQRRSAAGTLDSLDEIRARLAGG